ncbi:MAG: DNA polymerase II [Candidatus Woesearchaeota archaeon]
MKEYHGYIIDATYRIEERKAYVYLFGRLESGEAFVTKNYYEARFYIKESDYEKASSLLKGKDAIIKECEYNDPKGNKTMIILTSIPSNVPEYRSILESNDITCFEADIRFVRVFLMQKQVKGHITIKGEPSSLPNNMLSFQEPTIESSNNRPNIKLRTISIDIETSPEAKELYSISLYDDHTNKGYNLIVSDSKVSGAESYPNTSKLLARYEQLILSLDPDIITGWNVVDFDMNMIREYSKNNNNGTNIGRLGWKSELKIQRDYLRTSKATVPGRMVLDGLELLRNSYIDLENYTLGNAAKEILGEEKILKNEDRRHDIKELYENDKKKLVEYNQKDARLAYDIIKKLDLITLSYERTLITGLLLDEIRGAIASLDAIYLRELHKKNIVYYSVPKRERTSRIKGGYVKESSPGLYNNILLLDFKSLYPSIIATYNIDPLTHDDKGAIVAPNNARFLKEPEGLLPNIIIELSMMRDEAKKKNDKTASFALKTTMNSLFGVLANPQCRFYNMDIANAITYYGQHLIQKCTGIVEEKGYKVIYGDTDSIFVDPRTEDEKEAYRIGIEIASMLNERLREEIIKEHGRKSSLVLQFEKHYVMFWMPTIRGGEEGSKKRYAGLLNDNTINIVGLEYVRRDWTALAREFQYELLKILFEKKDPKEFIKKHVISLKKGEYDDKLVYRKALRKNIEDYTKTTPPHVKAARKLEKITDRIIEYVITVEGPEPITRQENPIDYDHYIDKQLKPLANAILQTIGMDFDDIIKNSTQKTLSGY